MATTRSNYYVLLHFCHIRLYDRRDRGGSGPPRKAWQAGANAGAIG
jgi:hypothetical protein